MAPVKDKDVLDKVLQVIAEHERAVSRSARDTQDKLTQLRAQLATSAKQQRETSTPSKVDAKDTTPISPSSNDAETLLAGAAQRVATLRQNEGAAELENSIGDSSRPPPTTLTEDTACQESSERFTLECKQEENGIETGDTSTADPQFSLALSTPAAQEPNSPSAPHSPLAQGLSPRGADTPPAEALGPSISSRSVGEFVQLQAPRLPTRSDARHESTTSKTSENLCEVAPPSPRSPQRSRRPSWNGATQHETAPRMRRRPSLGAVSGAGSEQGKRSPSECGSEVVDIDDDDVDGAIRILPVWEKKLRKPSQSAPHSPLTPSRLVGRRPSSGSNASSLGTVSDTSSDCAWNQDTVSRRRSLQVLRRSGTQLKITAKLGEQKSMWEKLVTRFTIKPSSRRRVAWDLFSAVVVGYDVIWIPMQVFDPEPNFYTQTMSWLVTVFWTVDIGVSFLSGYNAADGITEMRPSKVARHYIRTWFCFDVFVVLNDWVVGFTLLGLMDMDSALKTGKAARLGTLLRLARLLRLLRMIKANNVLGSLIECIKSEFWIIMLHLAKRLVIIMLLCHLIACMWYGIGTMDLSLEDAWVRRDELEYGTLPWRYTTSFHWALTQFSPASMEVVPTNPVERAFNIGVVIVGVVAFSSFVSSITNAMNRLGNLNNERLQKSTILRRFLDENKVSLALTVRIWASYRQAVDKSNHRIHSSEVSILSMLPVRVKADLWEEIYGPRFQGHPFFLKLANTYDLLVRKLYNTAIEETASGKGRELFLPGEKAEKMYVVMNGTMRFTETRSDVAGLLHVNGHDKISPGQWVCEAVLWIQWKHMGQMTAESHCELIAMKAPKMQEVLRRLEEPQRYAREFVQFFEKSPALLTDVFFADEALQNMAERAFVSLDELEDDDGDSNDFHSLVPSTPGLPGEAPEFPSENPPLLE